MKDRLRNLIKKNKKLFIVFLFCWIAFSLVMFIGMGFKNVMEWLQLIFGTLIIIGFYFLMAFLVNYREINKEQENEKKQTTFKENFLQVVGFILGLFLLWAIPVIIVLIVNFFKYVVFGDMVLSEFLEYWDVFSIEVVNNFLDEVCNWIKDLASKFDDLIERLKS